MSEITFIILGLGILYTLKQTSITLARYWAICMLSLATFNLLYVFYDINQQRKNEIVSLKQEINYLTTQLNRMNVINSIVHDTPKEYRFAPKGLILSNHYSLNSDLLDSTDQLLGKSVNLINLDNKITATAKIIKIKEDSVIVSLNGSEVAIRTNNKSTNKSTGSFNIANDLLIDLSTKSIRDTLQSSKDRLAELEN